MAEGLPQGLHGTSPQAVRIEHPMGWIDVTVSFERTADGIVPRTAGLVRSARLLARGEMMVPGTVWERPA